MQHLNFDVAVSALESAKEVLENAKRLLQDAVEQLAAAQEKVDRLCKFRECDKICIPGFKLKLCKGFLGIRYPCLRFTSCMISFPNPLCVAANILCRILRAAAFAVLQLAKVIVRGLMIALDMAKVAVTAAQFVVDKARIVLDIAETALDIAILRLDTAKQALDIAKVALEAIKQVVHLGLKALQFVVQYGVQSIIDVRNCGFEVKLSTHDLSVFDIHCEVNAFKLGWRTVRLRINFRDIVQSIWNAAKATIEAILEKIGDIFTSRKRREIQHHTMNTLYSYLRKSRDIVTNASDETINETLNIISQTVGFQNYPEGAEYEYRSEVFGIKCRDFKIIDSFLSESIEYLIQMCNETAMTISNATNILVDLDERFNMENGFDNLTMEDVGIDPYTAETEFNLSLSELNDTFSQGKKNLSSDEYFLNIKDFKNEATHILMNQTKDNVQILTQWIVTMENKISDYFSADECAFFMDCKHLANFATHPNAHPVGRAE